MEAISLKQNIFFQQNKKKIRLETSTIPISILNKDQKTVDLISFSGQSQKETSKPSENFFVRILERFEFKKNEKFDRGLPPFLPPDYLEDDSSESIVPYTREGLLIADTLIVPSGYSDKQTINTTSALEIQDNFSDNIALGILASIGFPVDLKQIKTKISKASCVGFAEIKGHIEEFTFKLDTCKFNSLKILNGTKIRTLNIEKNINKELLKSDPLYALRVKEEEKLFNYTIILQIPDSVLDDPANFQTVTINGINLPREDFIKIARSKKDVENLQDVQFYNPPKESLFKLLACAIGFIQTKDDDDILLKSGAKQLYDQEENPETYFKELIQFKHEGLITPENIASIEKIKFKRRNK